MESRILFSLSAVPLGACETLKGVPHWTGHSLLAFALFRANLAAFCFAIIDLICSNRAVSASLNFCSASARCLNRASALAGSLIYQLLSCCQIRHLLEPASATTHQLSIWSMLCYRSDVVHQSRPVDDFKNRSARHLAETKNYASHQVPRRVLH